MDNFPIKKRYTHTNTPKLTLTQNTNAKTITEGHTFTRGQQQVVDKAYTINVDGHRPFCVADYPLLSSTNFRRIIHELGDNIERVGNSRPQFYKLKGIKLPGDTRKVTLEPMGVQEEEFQKILAKLKDQPPAIHDVKIRIDNSELHSALLNKRYSKNKHNHSIKVNFEGFDNNTTTKILVYPNTIQVDIGCTYKPLVYNIKTIWYLHEHLSKISYHLTGLSGVILPSVDNWIITHYHYGKDGLEAINGQSFHHTIEDVNTGLIRFYSKLMKNGERIPRLEQIQTPQNSLSDEMKVAMFSEGV